MWAFNAVEAGHERILLLSGPGAALRREACTASIRRGLRGCGHAGALVKDLGRCALGRRRLRGRGPERHCNAGVGTKEFVFES